MDPLLALTCAALQGLASCRSPEDIAREAVDLAQATLAELERRAPKPAPATDYQPKGRR
jgi:hypothetical protein